MQTPQRSVFTLRKMLAEQMRFDAKTVLSAPSAYDLLALFRLYFGYLPVPVVVLHCACAADILAYASHCSQFCSRCVSALHVCAYAAAARTHARSCATWGAAKLLNRSSAC